MSIVQNRLGDLAHKLDRCGKTNLVASCIKILIDDKSYNSPAFGSSAPEIELLISKLAIANADELAHFTAPNAQGFKENQIKVVEDFEKDAQEMYVGRLAYHNDAWIPQANVKRARDGMLIIEWLSTIQQYDWMTLNIPPDIERLFFESSEILRQKFTATARFVVLVAELIQIGRETHQLDISKWYWEKGENLSENQRVKVIGSELFTNGHVPLMKASLERVCSALGPGAAQDLSAHWQFIGNATEFWLHKQTLG